jgi:hypothetical protein
MPLILLAGQDMSLLATRAAVLAELGAIVKSGACRFIDQLLREERIDLLVLCHTLPLAERESLIATARETSPAAEILQLVSTVELREMRLFPGVKIGFCQPARLVRQVEELLAQSSQAHPPQEHELACRRSHQDWPHRKVTSGTLLDAAVER